MLKAKKAWRHWHSSCRRAQRPADWVHARFATCGGRTAENVHPFVTDDYCLAMNGTVENAVALRSALNLLPYPDSDGAVLAALLQAYADSGTVAALRLCCREARGNYALAVLRRGEECLFACAHGAPLYAAVGGGGSACVSFGSVPAPNRIK